MACNVRRRRRVLGHSDIPDNYMGDGLTKREAMRSHPASTITLKTAKQLVKKKSKTSRQASGSWRNRERNWEKNICVPDLNDSIRYFTKKDQSTISRLRTQHLPSNTIINRICRQHIPECRLCSLPLETVDHNLFECKALADIRNLVLPQRSNTLNSVNSDKQQLEEKYKFYYLALE